MIIPDYLEPEREELIAEIHRAFFSVRRQRGTSWSETAVMDRYGSQSERAEARQQDRDAEWSELVDDVQWERGLGGFAFLDGIGFRYYLPAALVHDLRRGTPGMIQYNLGIGPFYDKKPPMPIQPDHRWALLDARQRACVARYIDFFATCLIDGGHHHEARPWTHAHQFWAGDKPLG